VLCCAGLLLLLAPAFALIALAVKLSSPGPVFYRQTRLGHGGRRFALLKFRSMATNADAEREQMEAANEATGPLFKMRRDPRVTTVGHWLRKFSLDELPQLLNVLKGDMSLVGPRPPLPEEVERYEPWQKLRLAVPQGLTGLWQVSGRSRLSFEEMVLLDLYYVENCSMLLDLEILLETVPTILHGDGAF
jgi:lipopolysaccharide/colanic/teichoic acid biosynthesis glycosyltransferase